MPHPGPPTALVARFRSLFGRAPETFAEAPGRVNLIGEHTDYNGLPVLPMAIERRVRVLAARRDDALVRLSSTDPRFPSREYTVGREIPPAPPGDWSNYHRAAILEVVGWPQGDPVSGADVLVDGDVPAAAGLSSSAALVVASALAAAALRGISPDPLWLAERLAVAEQYVGARSGGMDQAASLLGRAGHALRIDFFPLRVRPVPVPPGCSFVVAHSLVEAAKSGHAREQYNLRVRQCEEACRLLSRSLGRQVHRLGDLFLGPAPLRPEDAIEHLRRAGADDTVVRRARHVLSEAARVDAAERALRNGSTAELGRLMDESHASCRDDYQVSCPELDELVAIARSAGATGARLTGAGFGGCALALASSERAEEILQALAARFYRPRGAGDGKGRAWVLRPERGARVVRL